MSNSTVSMLRYCTASSVLSPCLFSSGTTAAQTTPGPDLTVQATLCVVGHAHLDTEWRRKRPKVNTVHIRKTMISSCSTNIRTTSSISAVPRATRAWPVAYDKFIL
jgi:hypothetical protein